MIQRFSTNAELACNHCLLFTACETLPQIRHLRIGYTFWIDKGWLSSQDAPSPEVIRLLTETVQSYEKELIEATLAENDGKVAGLNGAAAKLGIPAVDAGFDNQTAQHKETRQPVSLVQPSAR
jgi:hypothetical protein